MLKSVLAALVMSRVLKNRFFGLLEIHPRNVFQLKLNKVFLYFPPTIIFNLEEKMKRILGQFEIIMEPRRKKTQKPNFGLGTSNTSLCYLQPIYKPKS